jgi:4-amino-4-deoxy-L-arabinose transferase-like glycosyltransferase
MSGGKQGGLAGEGFAGALARHTRPKGRYLEGEGLLLGTYALALALAVILYFAFMGAYPLLDPDEGRYAEIAREMLESGDFLIPRLDYMGYLEKPPLFYWLLASSMGLFGQHEWAVRIVPGIAGFLTLLLTIGFGSRFLGRRTGFMAGWVYLTSVVPLVMARLPIIDGVFSLFLAATWGAWYTGYTAASATTKRRWYCLAWTCMALATMTKGIAAIVLTGAIISGMVAVNRQWNALRSMFPLRGLLIFAAIAFPWHLYVGIRYPLFWHFYFVVQHFGRLVGSEHVKPFWFFVLVFPFGMFPWTVFVLPAFNDPLRSAARTVNMRWKPASREKQSLFEKTTPIQETRQTQTLAFLILWVLAVVGLFSLSRCKLVPYILPAYPAMALMTGSYLAGHGRKQRYIRWTMVTAAVLLLAFIPVVSHFAESQHALPIGELTWPVRAAQGGLLIASLLLGLAAFRAALVPACTGLVLIAIVPSVMMTVPLASEYTKLGSILNSMPGPLPADMKIAEWDTYHPSLNFYTRRPVILVDVGGELEFGSRLGDSSHLLLHGAESLRDLVALGPLLVNLPPERWPEVRVWGTLHPVAANRNNVMVGNEAFFRLTGLRPWPEQAITSSPSLLIPRRRIPSEKG